MRVAPLGDPRVNACLAAFRGLSQPATSFIAFHCLGVHHLPLSILTTYYRMPVNITRLSKIKFLRVALENIVVWWGDFKSQSTIKRLIQ